MARARPILESAAIFLLACLSYANSVGGDFVSDDHALILEHPHIKEIREWPAIFQAGHYRGWGGYRPLTTLSFALNYSLSGGNPAGYHLVNILLHAVVSVLLGLLALRLFSSRAIALVSAALFAVHPIHAEAVAWISGRAELQAAFFVLLGWLLYEKASATAAARTKLWLASILCYFAGILSKENALVLPALIILGDLHCSLSLTASLMAALRSLLPRWPAYLGYAVAAGGYFAFRHLLYVLPITRRTDWISAIDNPIARSEVGVRLLTAIKVMGEYFLLLVWPRHLSADYSYNAVPVVTTPADPGFLFGLAVVLLALGIAVASLFRRGPLWLVIAIAFVTIAPAANLLVPTGTIKAERILYLPSIGFCLAFGILFISRMQRLRDRASGRRVVTIAAGAVLVCALLLLMARTWRRNLDWRSERTLWPATVAVVPNSARAQLRIGYQLQQAGELSEAIRAYRRALVILPDSRDAAMNLGVAFMQSGQAIAAIGQFEGLAAREPTNASVHLNLGLAHARANNVPAALAAFREAIRLNPSNAVAHFDLGLTLSASGDREAALEAYRRATELKSDYAEAWNALGAVHLKLGQKREAREALTRALALKPGYPDALHNLRLAEEQP